ncbi:putative universal stress protein [Ensifer sp. M14]|uniref:universal stress protein n=1 Tax=Ensifer sp. M14 TaxID=2203782 RepID=UPI000E2B39D5|nr:universal stress protein [Ensifer sp. M14]RDL47421.1 putative universal stress protein [Ensifer sp. M14]
MTTVNAIQLKSGRLAKGKMAMIRHILVATDGSEKAQEAVVLAANFARAVEARVTILHVILHGVRADEMNRLARSENLVRSVSGVVLPGQEQRFISMHDLFQSAQVDIGETVTALGERIAEDAAEEVRAIGVKDVSQRVEPGDYADTVLAVSQEIGADLIVVGSRGLGRLSGMVLGSVSQKIVQRALCSVMLVR